MIKNDYLMKAIDRLAQAFGQLITGPEQNSPQDCLDVIESHLAEAMNTRKELLFSQDISAVDGYDPRLAAELGRMFGLHARVALEAQAYDVAQASTQWAVRCLVRGIQQSSTPTAMMAEHELVAMLKHDLVARYANNLALSAYIELFDFARRTTRVPQAEDALFAAIELGAPPEFAERGRQFFMSLLELEEDSLSAHETSVAEIQEILEDLAS